MRFIDPDGMAPSTHTDSVGNVLVVYDDGDHGVYQHTDATSKAEVDKKREETGKTSGDGKKIGETEHIDEFKTGDFLYLGFGPIDDWVTLQQYKYVNRLAGMNPILVALLSEGGMPLDIKRRLPGVFRAGYQYDGYWMTAQSVGNRVAGKNAAHLNMPWSITIISSGALHIFSNRSFGSFKYWGETNYAGRQIRSGYNSIIR